MRTLKIFCAVTVSLTFPDGVNASAAEQMYRAYTVDDLLKIERIGALQFSPDGDSVLAEYNPPYGETGNYGVERGGQIIQLSLSGKTQARPLFKNSPREKYWLGDASPDGRRILVFQANRNEVRLGVYDFLSKSLTLVDEKLQIGEPYEMNSPVWINDVEIVFSSRSQNWNHYGVRERPFATDWTSTLREMAFTGENSAVVLSTDPEERWYDGYLLKYNASSKHVSVLGRGRYGHFKVSSDGARLAALRLGQRLLHYPVDQLAEYYRFDTQLTVFDLKNSTSQPFLNEMHVSMGSLRWSSTGTKLSFFAWDHESKMSDGTHYVLDSVSMSIKPVRLEGFAPSRTSLVRSGALTIPVAAEWLQEDLVIHGVLDGVSQSNGTFENSILDKQPSWHRIDYETMTAMAVIAGSMKYHQVNRLRDGRLLLHSDQGFFLASGSDAPKKLDVQNHNAIQVLNGGWGNEIEDTIVFARSNNGNREISFLDFDQGDLLTITVNAADEVVAWSPYKRQVITRSDTDDGGIIALVGRTETPQTLFTINSHLGEIELPRWDVIEYRGANGVDTYSCVLLPHNYDSQKSYPTIVEVYPGTGKGCRNSSVNHMLQVGRQFLPYDNNILSANGYLVVVASNTYEQNQINGTQYGGLQAQVDAALDALIEAGMTDPDRIGLWGFSNGSMASIWLGSVSDRYKAIVPMFGASSPTIEYYDGLSSTGPEIYIANPILAAMQYETEHAAMPLSMGRSAADDPLGYVEASPLGRAKNICSPLMMVHSDLDGFTPYHYEALFSSLYRLGKRAQLIKYYGEGHGLSSPGNIRDFYERVISFFDMHVKSGTATVLCN